GFMAGVTVSFGGTNGVVTYLGPSALQVVTPAHAAAVVSVTATNPTSAASTLANAFNFTNGVVFTPPPMRLPMLTQRGNGFVTLFDADGDGDLDAFIGRRQTNCDDDGNDQLWLNDGTGTFSVSPTFPGDLSRVTV